MQTWTFFASLLAIIVTLDLHLVRMPVKDSLCSYLVISGSLVIASNDWLYEYLAIKALASNS